jgi:hypothetical protein
MLVIEVIIGFFFDVLLWVAGSLVFRLLGIRPGDKEWGSGWPVFVTGLAFWLLFGLILYLVL